MMCAPIVTGIVAEAGGLTLRLDLPPDLPCFQGHYPGFPILPGVVQIDWVMHLAHVHLRVGCRSATDFRIKFRRVIGPGGQATLELRPDAARGRLDFAYRSGGAIASQGRVMLAVP